MLKVQGLRVLAVPAAVGLAGLLVVACMERNPTAPDGANVPSLSKNKPAFYDDPRGDGVCPGNDPVLHAGDIDYNDIYDLNNNDTICFRATGGGGKHK
jgi:hypothetical protein